MPENAIVERILMRVGELPAMPDVVSEVLRLTDDTSADMDQVSAAIQADPALTAKMLRVANSSYYGMKQYVGTLKLALVILGVREVRNIVLGISVFESLKGEGVAAEVAGKIWDRSLEIGGVAKGLGANMGLGLQGEEFISGLLSDIGRMVLIRELGEEYVEMLSRLGDDPLALCDAELEEVGCTHADLAMALAASWSLPEGLTDALWYQYPDPDRPLKNAADPQLAAVLRIAKFAVLDDFSALEKVVALKAAEAWNLLADTKNPISEDRRFEVLKGYIEEVRNAPSISL